MVIIRDLRVQLSWPTHHPPPSPPSPDRVGAGTAHLVPFLTASPPRSPVPVGSTLPKRATQPQSVSLAAMLAVGGQCRPPAHLGTIRQGRGPARPACREMFSARTDDSAHPHPDPRLTGMDFLVGSLTPSSQRIVTRECFDEIVDSNCRQVCSYALRNAGPNATDPGLWGGVWRRLSRHGASWRG